MRPQERDALTTHQKLEEINTRLAQHDRRGQVTLLLVAVLNVVVIAMLAFLLLGYD